ncbi:hypothetical protein [Flavivirga jejuensis]|uniref:Uncharacterized protein n=1 Tax=Flavivirga jejuensis TaxID=870487 RepID=A0ABT8WQU6_9FLAO|nr:hypothetical protein [Flavivirga jejuensis]MDO5975518.1 hypothetical protein [Flavivirga jejuensis]
MISKSRDFAERSIDDIEHLPEEDKKPHYIAIMWLIFLLLTQYGTR